MTSRFPSTQATGDWGVKVAKVANKLRPADRGRALDFSTPSRRAAHPTSAAGGRPPNRLADLESLFARPSDDVTLTLIGGQRLLREATASLLTREDGLRVPITFESVADYRAARLKNQPAVLLLDCEESDRASWQRAIGELCSPHVESRIGLLCSRLARTFSAARSSTL